MYVGSSIILERLEQFQPNLLHISNTIQKKYCGGKTPLASLGMGVTIEKTDISVESIVFGVAKLIGDSPNNI